MIKDVNITIIPPVVLPPILMTDYLTTSNDPKKIVERNILSPWPTHFTKNDFIVAVYRNKIDLIAGNILYRRITRVQGIPGINDIFFGNYFFEHKQEPDLRHIRPDLLWAIHTLKDGMNDSGYFAWDLATKCMAVV